MLNQSWHSRLQALERQAARSQATVPQPSQDDAAFFRDWERLRALHLRFGIPFSLMLIRARDAIRPSAPLTQSVGDAVGERIMSFVAAEDSAVELGGRMFAVLLAGEDEQSGSAIAEALSNDSISLASFSGTSLIQLDVTISGWREEIGSLSALFDVVESKLQTMDSSAREAVAFDGWSAPATG